MNGDPLLFRRYTWVMLNKPAGFLSATEDGRGKTVLELLPRDLQRQELFPVGRLDKDTEGLLLLTNEGGLAHALLSPKRHVDKVYYVRTSGRLTEEDCRLSPPECPWRMDFNAFPPGWRFLRLGKRAKRGLPYGKESFIRLSGCWRREESR